MLNKRFLSLFGVLLLTTILTVPQAAQAIMTYGNDNLNLIGPTGEYASIGYQYMARIQVPVSANNPMGLGNAAIPISEHWALQANHIGASVGEVINFNGTQHTILERQLIGSSDLLLVRVDNAFSNYVYMYDPTQDGISETMRDSVLVGGSSAVRDTNNPIYTTTPGTGAQLFNGWNVRGDSSGLGQLSWGLNRVEGVTNVYSGDAVSECLYTTFDQPTLPDGSPNPAYIGANEAAAFSGDSGGGMFIMQNGQWRLAGQIYAVDAARITAGGPGDVENIMGPIVDGRNMWYREAVLDGNGNPVLDGNGNQTYKWVQIEDSNPVPFATYSVKISSYRSEIDRITGETRGLGAFSVVPEAGTAPLMLGAMGLALGAIRLRRRS